MDYYKIGQFIQERRKELNLTQKQLGQKLNVTDKAVSKWERGLGCPDVSILGELSEILDVGIAEILNGEYNEKLKDNSEFVKQAVDYSKKITENNIYSKIVKILYAILIFIVMYISFLGIKQFIYINETISINSYEQLALKCEEIKEKINIIKQNQYFNDNEKLNYYISLLDDMFEYFEHNHIITNERKYYETAALSTSFMYIEVGNNLLGSLLIEVDPDNSKYYKLINYTEKIYIENDAMIDVDNNVFYEDMYMYERINESDKVNYYYDVLVSRLSKLSMTLDFAIEIGELNA